MSGICRASDLDQIHFNVPPNPLFDYTVQKVIIDEAEWLLVPRIELNRRRPLIKAQIYVFLYGDTEDQDNPFNSSKLVLAVVEDGRLGQIVGDYFTKDFPKADVFQYKGLWLYLNWKKNFGYFHYIVTQEKLHYIPNQVQTSKVEGRTGEYGKVNQTYDGLIEHLKDNISRNSKDKEIDKKTITKQQLQDEILDYFEKLGIFYGYRCARWSDTLGDNYFGEGGINLKSALPDDLLEKLELTDETAQNSFRDRVKKQIQLGYTKGYYAYQGKDMPSTTKKDGAQTATMPAQSTFSSIMIPSTTETTD